MTVFTVLLVLVYTIPTEPIRAHLAADIPQLQQEGTYPRPFFGDVKTQGDNFTEALVLSMCAANYFDKPILTQAMNNSVEFDTEHPIESLAKMLDPNTLPEVQLNQYGVPKYWNGELVLLKPVMWLSGYRDARVILFQLSFLLAALVLLALRRRLGIFYALGFAFSLTAVRFFAVPSSVTMCFPWLVALGTCLLLLRKPILSDVNYLLLFFGAGCCFNYFDYMLTPLIGLALPLVVLFSLIVRGDEQRGPLRMLGLLAGTSSLYFIGFSLSWCFKWALSSWQLKWSVFDQALQSILWRSEQLEGTDRFYGIKLNYGILATPLFKVTAAVVLVLLLAAVALFYTKNKHILKNSYVFVLIALYPCVWYFMISNHSIIHSPFVYRYTIITVLAVLFGLLTLIDAKRVQPKRLLAQLWPQGAWRAKPAARPKAK